MVHFPKDPIGNTGPLKPLQPNQSVNKKPSPKEPPPPSSAKPSPPKENVNTKNISKASIAYPLFSVNGNVIC